MPFEQTATAPRKIAVIGAGISGMGAAHRLSDLHNVTLFDAAPRLGGHARTVMAGKNGTQPVDTGFIVFNRVNYPNLVRLFEELDVPVVESDMSFAASIDGGRMEYSLKSLRTLFGQPVNALRPSFLRMVRDVLKFNANALEVSQDKRLSVGGLLDRLGTGDWFRDYYLLPLSGAIWSSPKDRIMEFPAWAMIRFFDNHALLHHTGQHQWYTVQGGSVEYVRRLEAALRRKGVQIRLDCPVMGVRRNGLGPEVRAEGGEWEAFDDVVFATHSDDTLRLLSDPSEQERRVLGAIRYHPNRAVLHSDPSVMPTRRAMWSSWNYAGQGASDGDGIDLTYWMNSLQPIPQGDPLFVTLNSRRPIRDELIHDIAAFRHPVFDGPAIAAQAEVPALNGTRNTWFCGAWVRNGFHEDGLASALDVVAGINRIPNLRVAAE
ncbi:MAG: FAD-dependent oxidoreductase [Pseudomonadota bacterium]|nr:FAD-dependent oxidoreductase [Pseudomonadota bacterium]